MELGPASGIRQALARRCDRAAISPPRRSWTRRRAAATFALAATRRATPWSQLPTEPPPPDRAGPLRQDQEHRLERILGIVRVAQHVPADAAAPSARAARPGPRTPLLPAGLRIVSTAIHPAREPTVPDSKSVSRCFSPSADPWFTFVSPRPDRPPFRPIVPGGPRTIPPFGNSVVKAGRSPPMIARPREGRSSSVAWSGHERRRAPPTETAEIVRRAQATTPPHRAISIPTRTSPTPEVMQANQTHRSSQRVTM